MDSSAHSLFTPHWVSHFPNNGVLIPKTIYTDGEVDEIEGDTILIDEKEKDAVKERSLQMGHE